MLIIILNERRHSLHSHLVHPHLFLCVFFMAKDIPKNIEELEPGVIGFLSSKGTCNPSLHLLWILLGLCHTLSGFSNVAPISSYLLALWKLKVESRFVPVILALITLTATENSNVSSRTKKWPIDPHLLRFFDCKPKFVFLQKKGFE